jgi:hypothetical protein
VSKDEIEAMNEARAKCSWAHNTESRNSFLHGFDAGIEYARRTVSGQEAQPIYQARSINSVTWTDQSKDGYDHMAKYPMCFEVRIVYAAPIPATELKDAEQ